MREHPRLERRDDPAEADVRVELDLREHRDPRRSMATLSRLTWMLFAAVATSRAPRPGLEAHILLLIQACRREHPGQDSMSQTNIDIVKAFFKAMETGDMAAMGALLDPQFHIEKPKSLPHGGVYRGPNAIAELFRAGSQAYDMRRTRFEHQLFSAAADRVFVLVRCLLCPQGAAEPYETTSVEVLQLKDGKLLQMKTFYEDTAEDLRRHASHAH